MKPLIVPDVNVLVSGAVGSQHAPAQIVEAWKEGRILFATSESILNDLKRVFTYPRVLKFTQMTLQEIDAYSRIIVEGATVVPSIEPEPVSTDPEMTSCLSVRSKPEPTTSSAATEIMCWL